MPDLDIWNFVAGLGIFLLGINQMEGGIQSLAGRSFRKFIRKHTNNPFKAVFVGLIITAIVQSSSVVSLMVLAFVGARIIPLRNAIAIILGTNIGTTVTGWIVASIGFKFPIDAFALPFLGIGGILVTFFSARPFFSEIGRLLVGLGALFLGLDYMKTAIDVATIETSFFESVDVLPQLFFPIGVILTAVIQSSSATMAITLSALYAGVIPLEVAAAIVIGSDLGTTSTVVLGGLKGSHIKRQVAFGHVGFNLLAGTVALLLLCPLIYFVKEVLMIKEALFQLVAFHSIFNLLGVVILLPFLTKYAEYLQKLIKSKKKVLSPLIISVPPEITEGGIEALKKEAIDLKNRVRIFSEHVIFQDENRGEKSLFAVRSNSFLEEYRNIQLKEGELISYFLKVQKYEITDLQSLELQNQVSAIKSLSMAAKSLKNVVHTIKALKAGDDELETSLNLALQTQHTSYFESFVDNGINTEALINKHYRENVGLIYEMLEKKVIREDELTSFLHMNSELKQFKSYFFKGSSL